VLALFQPHGFGPLKFMREPLAPALQRQLRPGDRFAFLPVYYAGGTTDFTPSSAEVAAELRQRGLEVLSFPDRAAAASFVRTARDFTAVLVLGARDPGLPAWCATLRAGR
jgi:UDP-N-acetylmuramate--alanine ligase